MDFANKVTVGIIEICNGLLLTPFNMLVFGIIKYFTFRKRKIMLLGK